MKVVILSPKRVFLAGAASALLMLGCMMGVLAAAGVFGAESAQAYGEEGVGAKRWYFAEGYTGPGFEEWILVYNPPSSHGGSGVFLSPTIYMYGNEGFIGTFSGITLQPGQRASLDIKQLAYSGYGYSGDISIVVEASYPFLCERAMYFDYKGRVAGGSQVLGYQEGAGE